MFSTVTGHASYNRQAHYGQAATHFLLHIGLSVRAVDGAWADFLGCHRRGKRIDVAVKNLSTWCHELVHTADDRNGNLKEMGQHWRSETVAELGGTVLLEVLGLGHDADLGGCFGYVQTYAQKEEIGVTEACMQVLERTCAAVGLILDAAEEMKQEISTATVAGGWGVMVPVAVDAECQSAKYRNRLQIPARFRRSMISCTFSGSQWLSQVRSPQNIPNWDRNLTCSLIRGPRLMLILILFR